MKRLESKIDKRIQNFLLLIIYEVQSDLFPAYLEFNGWDILVDQIANFTNPRPTYSIVISTKGDDILRNGKMILKSEIIIGPKDYEVYYYKVIGGLKLKKVILENFETA